MLRPAGFGAHLRVDGQGVQTESFSALTGKRLPFAALTQNISTSSNDAVAVTLSRKAPQSEDASSPFKIEITAAGAAGGSQSTLGSVLKQVATVSKQVYGLTEALKSDTLTVDQRAGFSQELDALKQEYQRIVTSDDFKQIVEVAGSVENSLRLGSRSKDLFRAVGGERGVVGDDFLSLIQGANLFGIQTVLGSFATLQSASLDKVTEDPSILSTIDSAVGSAIDALSGPTLQAPDETVQTTAGIPLIQIDPPELTQQNFALAGGLSLAIRGYSGEDLLKAAQAHYDIDPRTVITLAFDNSDEDKKPKLNDPLDLNPEK